MSSSSIQSSVNAALASDRWRNALAAAVLAGYLLLVAVPATRGVGSFAVYYVAASLLMRQPAALAHVYDDAWFASQLGQVNPPGVYDVFFYNPPTMSLLMLPLVGFAPQLARLIWTLLGVALLLGGLVLLARGLALPAQWGLWAMPLALLYAPVTENLQAGQVYLLLFFLCCMVFWGLARSDDGRSTIDDASKSSVVHRPPSVVSIRERDLIAGLALALMLVLKFAGAWLWPLLLIAGRWRALAWAGVFVLGLVLASLPLIGTSAWQTFFALLPNAAADPRRTVAAYQTVTSFFGHVLDYDARWNPEPLADAPWAARALTVGTTLGALVVSGYWLRRTRQNWPLGIALCMALVVTNAPFAEGYHYTLMLAPLLVAVWWARRARMGWRAWAVLALAALLLGAPLPYKAAEIQAGWWALAAYPRVYGAYLLWGWIAWALARTSQGIRDWGGAIGNWGARSCSPIPDSHAPNGLEEEINGRYIIGTLLLSEIRPKAAAKDAAVCSAGNAIRRQRAARARLLSGPVRRNAVRGRRSVRARARSAPAARGDAVRR